MARRYAFLLAVLFAVVPAGLHAQQNVLLGSWRSSQPATRVGPANTVTLTFFPTGRYRYEQAFAGRGDGYGSGVVTAVGTYRLAGPSQLQWRVEQAQICAAGAYCQAKPDLIGSGTMNVSFQGTNRMNADGAIFFRVR